MTTSAGCIVALIPDLMFGIRVRDVVQQLGYTAIVVETAAAAHNALHPDLALLIVDLRSPIDAVQPLIVAAKSLDAHLPILAFGSHVDVARQRAARAAGCDRVVANSKFSTDLPQLVTTMARPTPDRSPISES